ncbi:MAG: hypothetical protein WDM89_16440 [Rhizomicrobium sp.]
MNLDRAFFGILVAAVPTAFVLYGLVAMGIVGLRKPPEEKESPPSSEPLPPQKITVHRKKQRRRKRN